MAQYIDKSPVVAELKRRIQESLDAGGATRGVYLSERMKEDSYILSFIDTLEVIEVGVDFGDPKGDKSAKCIIDTKTIEVKEVDLEKELDSMITPELKFHKALPSLFDVAKHFFELGLNAQHSSIGIPNIDDIFEEEGIDPNSKDAKIFKESYYMALEKLKEQKGEGV